MTAWLAKLFAQLLMLLGTDLLIAVETWWAKLVRSKKQADSRKNTEADDGKVRDDETRKHENEDINA